MAGATYTETALSDDVNISCQRVRIPPSTLDWNITVNCRILDASGNVLKVVSVDAAALFTTNQLNTFKASLNTAVSTAASNRGIAANT